MQLKDLLKDIYDKPITDGFENLSITDLCVDSREVTDGAMFVAVKGAVSDGAKFIESAIEKGATCIVCENDDTKNNSTDVCFIYVDDTFKFLRVLARRYFNNPSRHLNMFGITGTNGKTTVSYLIESILHEAEKSCSVVGTVNYRIGERILPAINTTPGLIPLQRLLSYIAEEGIENCVMEVSSHALDQGRVDVVNFDVAVFTNLTSDHLDYHKTRDNYFAAKAKLFTGLKSDARAVINIDDDYGPKLFSKSQAQIMTYGIYKKADVRAQDVYLDVEASQFKIVTSDGEVSIRSALVGEFNVYNILAATAACLASGISLDKIKKGVERLINVPGRLEKISFGQEFTIFIDYAHTQDALHNVLTAIKNTTEGRIICMFGCGGERDVTKRSEMGAVASELADYTIITNDNPRSEDPKHIIEQIKEGFDHDRFEIIESREDAIGRALNIAKKGDVVLIAGKGHEDYQVFKDQTIKFNEKDIIRNSILS
ncbi:MAG: UDP-N-acetylmuramoyl-L-alanyl-D-glutamate--2,6-diaminopimelate ligase [Candidatus Omnitrophota bacterium]|jgi:UDP-N-acetylmuramoyl-L-alanyl-D-glutamate--2,6-diaminopimelate ligase